jgi:uncharacterized protein with GYD domain
MIFITQGRYTHQGMMGLASKPEDRSKAVKALIEAAGGRLLAFYFTFGEYDFMLITEGPSEQSVAGALMAAALSGTVTDLKTTLAITPADAKGVFASVGDLTKKFRPAGK